jgi:hypothetical protein
MNIVFEPIDLNRQDAYRHKLSRCPQIASEYSFVNLWSWGPEYGLSWAWSDDLVWIHQSLPTEACWAPVGDWTTVDWHSLLPSLRALTSKVIRVPEKLGTIWLATDDEGLRIAETRGQWDYLYSREELVELKGNRFHKKKNLVAQFKKSYAYEYLPFGPPMVEQALAMQEDWCTWRDCESHETLAAENKAIERVLKNWNALRNLTGGALRVGDMLVAYTIAERLPDDTLVIHFEKGNPEYKGSYQAINQLFLEHAPEACRRVNREQDLDNEGLRQAKLSYQPIDFIKKFQVEF